MRLFLLTFLSIYGLIHLYAFLKARSALRFGAVHGTVLGLFMALMVFDPIIIRFSERLGFDVFAGIMSYIGYIWMGLLFLFFSFSLLVDIYCLAVWLYRLISRHDISHLMPSRRVAFFLPLIFALAIGVYGYIEAANIRTEYLVVKTAKMPKEKKRLRIVQISDVHIGLVVRERRLAGIADMIKTLNPDILVSTGDLVDGQINRIAGFADILDNIKAPYGKFAILGNHEYYAGFDQSTEFIRKAGFRLLKGEGVTIPGFINVAGIDDIAARRFGLYTGIPETNIISTLDPEQFTLLLKHRPLVDKASLGMFDLQLSGHTHRGQIFPFNFIVQLYFPRISGYFDLKGDSHLYVSRGTGTWGPPIRFLSPPEITVIDLVRE